MAVSKDRKFSGKYVYTLLESVKGKTLGEVDKSRQFDRTISNPKITGIAGDVVEQSVFGYERDSKQECDIEIDGLLTELKTTGVRVPKSLVKKAFGKTGEEYNIYLRAKEGISVTGVTFEPNIQTEFDTSHFWEKAKRILIVFYEYKSYEVVPASEYARFPIVDYCYNTFSENERMQLMNDWNLVSSYLQDVYSKYPNPKERNAQLVGFTHKLRPNLLLIELVPGFKQRDNGSYQKPRYRLKQTFIDYIVRGHFDKSRVKEEIKLYEPFNSFAQLDERCRAITKKYKGKNLAQLKEELEISTDIAIKNFTSECVVKMFGAPCKKINQISDFQKVGIIAKTITITPKGDRTEDMKLKAIDFEEWADRNVEFEASDVYDYFCEHSFLCPIFCEHDSKDDSKTTFEGFKRFAFDEQFLKEEVYRTWSDTRKLIHDNTLKWEYSLDEKGNKRVNKSGAYIGAPNFPKSRSYIVFLRGGALRSTDADRTECVNGIKMLPQFFWIKGSYVVEKLKNIPFI